MNKVLKHKYTHYILVLIVALVAGYAYFGATPVGEAEVIKTIGSLKVSLDPEPPSVGTEYVALQYEGHGVMDVTSWRIENNSGLVFELPVTILSSGESVKMCSNIAADREGCSYEWVGGLKWGTDDTLIIVDDTGNTRLSKSYSGAESGSFITGDIPLDAPVLTKKDSIDTCHSVNGSKYSNVNGNVSNIAKGKGGHGQHFEYDIIPPFFYLVDGVFGFYQGMNWEDGQEIYENNCGKK